VRTTAATSAALTVSLLLLGLCILWSIIQG
jgi:hypothetical protein